MAQLSREEYGHQAMFLSPVAVVRALSSSGEKQAQVSLSAWNPGWVTYQLCHCSMTLIFNDMKTIM